MATAAAITEKAAKECAAIMKKAVADVKRLEEYDDTTRRLRKLLVVTRRHKCDVMKIESLKEVQVYCRLSNLPSRSYGPLLERFIVNKFGYTRLDPREAKGDCYKDGLTVEIKASLGGEAFNKFNFVQIRPAHKCNFYVFIAHHLSRETISEHGELYIFKVPAVDMNDLIVTYGSYAHGTKKKYGVITHQQLQTDSKEYALRPKLGDKCWKALLPFRIDESEL